MDQLAPEDSALLDFVNGKGTTGGLLTLVLVGYLVFSDSAKAKLQELAGAVHEWNKSPENG